MAKIKLRRLPKAIWRSIKRHRARRRREAVKREKALKLTTAKAPKTRPIDSSDQSPTLLQALRVRAHQAAAQYAADRGADRGDAPVARGSRADAAELIDLRDRMHNRRRDRRHTFECAAHSPPARFASIADLNQHLAEDHREPAEHPRGTESQIPVVKPQPPPRRRQPDPAPATIDPLPPPPGATAATRAPAPKRKRAPRTKFSGPKSKDEALQLEANLVLIKVWVDNIKTEAMTTMGAGNAAATLGDIGSMKISSVSQITAAATALEGIALAIEEAVTGFQQNMRVSEQAPIDQEVVNKLTPAVAGAQQIARSAVQFLAAFDEMYRDAIAKAKAGERVDNTALTN